MGRKIHSYLLGRSLGSFSPARAFRTGLPFQHHFKQHQVARGFGLQESLEDVPPCIRLEPRATASLSHFTATRRQKGFLGDVSAV